MDLVTGIKGDGNGAGKNGTLRRIYYDGEKDATKCSKNAREGREDAMKNGLNDIHVHRRVRRKTFEYTGWPSSMPTTRDTNRSFGDR